LKARAPIVKRSPPFSAPYEERVIGVAYQPWAIATISSFGDVRQWRLAGDELIQRPGSRTISLGNSAQRICAVNDMFYLTSGDNVYSLNSKSDINKIAELGFRILDMCVVNETSLLACGKGGIAVINILSGTFVKIFGTSSKRTYHAVAAVDETQFFVGTDDGELYSYDGQSHIETGNINCDIAIAGLIALKDKLLVYGGGKSKSRALMVYSWKLELINAEAVAH
jgi:hypothetical protein